MQSKSLAEWLAWQETLSPVEIDLGLERVRIVAARLQLRIPRGRVFVIAGTNGKGTCATVLATMLSGAGFCTGLYTSPHLLRYNERVAVDGRFASDQELVAAFEAIEAVRGDVPLTYFEFGTLAALFVFSAHRCAVWVLEVGLGGRLDAVNAIDGDFSVITTVDLDHQQWLGDTIEQIAAEKAGIIHAQKPAFYGDSPVPLAVSDYAKSIGAPLSCLGQHFRYIRNATNWDWFGASASIAQLPLPAGKGEEQLKNIALAFAVIESYDPNLLIDREQITKLIGQLQLPGRFQIIRKEHEWILDVAHNQQAARALRDRLLQIEPPVGHGCTFVLGMLADKQALEFVRPLAELGSRWIVCPTGGSRGSSPEALRDRIASAVHAPIEVEDSVGAALSRARAITPLGGRIVVCGSFMTVGPALEWLGL
jgi:dihydrofolate synthase / folylpolyglutamate synthase